MREKMRKWKNEGGHGIAVERDEPLDDGFPPHSQGSKREAKLWLGRNWWIWSSNRGGVGGRGRTQTAEAVILGSGEIFFPQRWQLGRARCNMTSRQVARDGRERKKIFARGT